jgi:hypothetical protein
MSFAKHAAVVLAAVLTLVAASAVSVADEVPDPAAKVDSGLGALPYYTEWKAAPWLYATPAESVDDGLGAIPDAARITEVWLYAMPAEKLDSGLGEIVATDSPARR